MFEVTARLTIRDGELESFKRQAGEMMKADHTVAFYAPPSADLAEALDAMPPGAVTLKQFSLFQALDAGVEVTEEVPA